MLDGKQRKLVSENFLFSSLASIESTPFNEGENVIESWRDGSLIGNVTNGIHLAFNKNVNS